MLLTQEGKELVRRHVQINARKVEGKQATKFALSLRARRPPMKKQQVQRSNAYKVCKTCQGHLTSARSPFN